MKHPYSKFCDTEEVSLTVIERIRALLVTTVSDGLTVTLEDCKCPEDAYRAPSQASNAATCTSCPDGFSHHVEFHGSASEDGICRRHSNLQSFANIWFLFKFHFEVFGQF